MSHNCKNCGEAGHFPSQCKKEGKSEQNLAEKKEDGEDDINSDILPVASFYKVSVVNEATGQRTLGHVSKDKFRTSTLELVYISKEVTKIPTIKKSM